MLNIGVALEDNVTKPMQQVAASIANSANSAANATKKVSSEVQTMGQQMKNALALPSAVDAGAKLDTVATAMQSVSASTVDSKDKVETLGDAVQSAVQDKVIPPLDEAKEKVKDFGDQFSKTSKKTGDDAEEMGKQTGRAMRDIDKETQKSTSSMFTFGQAMKLGFGVSLINLIRRTIADIGRTALESATLKGESEKLSASYDKWKVATVALLFDQQKLRNEIQAMTITLDQQTKRINSNAAAQSAGFKNLRDFISGLLTLGRAVLGGLSIMFAAVADAVMLVVRSLKMAIDYLQAWGELMRGNLVGMRRELHEVELGAVELSKALHGDNMTKEVLNFWREYEANLAKTNDTATKLIESQKTLKEQSYDFAQNIRTQKLQNKFREGGLEDAGIGRYISYGKNAPMEKYLPPEQIAEGWTMLETGASRTAAIVERKAADMAFAFTKLWAEIRGGGIDTMANIGGMAMRGDPRSVATTTTGPQVEGGFGLPILTTLTMIQAAMPQIQEAYTVWRSQNDMMSVSFGNMASSMAGSMFDIIEATAAGKAKIGQALKAMAADSIRALGAEARVKAIYELAEGVRLLVTPGGQALAAGHFKAAAIYASVAGATAAAAGALSRGSDGGGRGSSASAGRNVSRETLGDTGTNRLASQPSRVYNIHMEISGQTRLDPVALDQIALALRRRIGDGTVVFN